MKKLEAESAEQQKELRTLQARLSGAEEAVTGDGLWFARPLVPPENYGHRLAASIPIITVANLKGGVGKTTLTAHLTRFYASKGKRVLAIDLDYQGSLSALVSESNRLLSRVSRFVVGDGSGQDVLEATQPLENSPGDAGILTAFYELARIENQAMVHWLTQREQRDVRYFIADVLLSEPVQTGYDIILIDAAPRITTSTVQALCASKHVLIPTKLDGVSADAVGYFARQLIIMKKLWPYLEIAGVVGTMTEKNVGSLTNELYDIERLVDFEAQAVLRVEEHLARAFEEAAMPKPASPIFPYTTFVPEKRDIARLANDGFGDQVKISLNSQSQIQAIFERLGQELAIRIGLHL
ncbi:MAG: ParA family protein [Pseudomonadota bacterium]